LLFFKTTANFLLGVTGAILEKEGELLISQPIKGTSKRFLDPIKDEESKNKLASDPKERSENIMITDLVRNDLSQTAQKDLYRLQNYAVFILLCKK
jgi:para-aminobenzoate synthetase component 1